MVFEMEAEPHSEAGSSVEHCVEPQVEKSRARACCNPVDSSNVEHEHDKTLCCGIEHCLEQGWSNRMLACMAGQLRCCLVVEPLELDGKEAEQS